MGHFFYPQFWFNQRPDLLSAGSRNALIAFICALFLAAIIGFILKRRKDFYRRLYGKLFNFFLSNALIGAILLFFCQEQIPLLSSRFWYLLWVLGLAVWLGFIIKYAKTLPEKKKQSLREQEFKKYLP